MTNIACGPRQWRRQRSKGARSFRGQKIVQPGHVTRIHFFPQKRWQPFFQLPPSKHRPPTPFHRQAVIFGNIFIFCSHYYWSKAICRAWARAVDLPARSFDLAHSCVVPPLDLETRDQLRPLCSTFKFSTFLARKMMPKLCVLVYSSGVWC